MKRHLFFTFLTIALATCFSSCLKDETTSSTVIYSSQQIPNINKFMPSHLIEMMGSSRIHYGDEPPRFSGHYQFDSLVYRQVRYENEALSQHPYNANNLAGDFGFYFTDQVKCILSTRYVNVNPIINPIDESVYSQFTAMSNPDTTYHYFKNSFKPIATSPDKPIYFEGDIYDKDDFSHAFIIGSGNYFTIYYYDVTIQTYDDNWPYSRNDFHRVTANIISGKLTKYSEIVPNANDSTVMDTVSRYRIDNFCWGKEDMGYFNEGTAIQLLIESGGQPTPGDVAILDNFGKPIYPSND